jgi:hypothetical protein
MKNLPINTINPPITLAGIIAPIVRFCIITGCDSRVDTSLFLKWFVKLKYTKIREGRVVPLSVISHFYFLIFREKLWK